MKMTDVITVLRAKAPEADLALRTATHDLEVLGNLVGDFATVESEGAKKAIASAIGDSIQNIMLDFNSLRDPIGDIVTANAAYKRQFGKRRGPAPDLPGQLVMDM